MTSDTTNVSHTPSAIVARGRRNSVALLVLIGIQIACAAFFLSDAFVDLNELGLVSFRDPHLVIETLAALSLLFGVWFEWRFLMRLLRRQSHLEQAVGIASGALHDLIEAHFADWNLTAAEADVALFTLKGYAIAEVASLRGSAEGTVKAQLNAIYRKAGVSGRGQLVSLLLEDLMRDPLI